MLVRKEKAGLGTAYRAGFAIGIERGYEVIVQMDADLSHDPAAIPPLVGALDDDVGLAIGRATCPAATSRTGRGTAGSCRGTATSTRGWRSG